MKKILLILSSFGIGAASTSAVVACGFREPKNVILELTNTIARPGSPILTAYRQIVNAYNQDRPNNSIKVEVRETPPNNIDNEIATSQPLPNLYVSYPDSSTKYETILKQIDEQDKIVDMAEVVNWNPDYANNITDKRIAFIKNFANNATKGNQLSGDKPLDEITFTAEERQNPELLEKYRFTPLRDSFPKEGSNNNKMYVVPTAKSGMNGVINTRLITEMVKMIANIDLSKTIKGATIRGDSHFFRDGQVDWSRVVDTPLKTWDQTSWKLPPRNTYRDSEKTITELFQEWFGDVVTIDQLQAVLKDLSKLTVILAAYMKLVDSSASAGAKDYFKTSFSMAIDDVPGFIYTMQGNLGYGDDQVYSWNNEEPYTLTLNKNNVGSRALQDIIEFFGWADNLRPLKNDSGNTPDHGYGGVTAKLNSGMYYSDSWQKQGMLVYFGSTSGARYWTKPNPSGQDLYVQTEDIQLLSAPSYGNEHINLVAQQGPGMGMFKSSNQFKNEIAIDFVNYFIRPENNTKFAIAAGYIPSNYYAYYSQKGTTGSPDPENQGAYYQELVRDKSEIKVASIVKNYVDNILDDKVQLWTQTPTPFGDAMRFQILAPWFESNFKTVQDHTLNFEQFWKDLESQSSISSAWRVVRGIFPIEGNYEIR